MDERPDPLPEFDLEELQALLAGVVDHDARVRIAATYAQTHPRRET